MTVIHAHLTTAARTSATAAITAMPRARLAVLVTNETSPRHAARGIHAKSARVSRTFDRGIGVSGSIGRGV